MAVKKKKRRHTPFGRRRMSPEAVDRRLAPPEEQAVANNGGGGQLAIGDQDVAAQGAARGNGDEEGRAARDDGAIVLNTGALNLPRSVLTEEGGAGIRGLRFDPAVLVIICLALLFIAGLALVIWAGWEPPRN